MFAIAFTIHIGSWIFPSAVTILFAIITGILLVTDKGGGSYFGGGPGIFAVFSILASIVTVPIVWVVWGLTKIFK